jgi:hypothetical protein
MTKASALNRQDRMRNICVYKGFNAILFKQIDYQILPLCQLHNEPKIHKLCSDLSSIIR